MVVVVIDGKQVEVRGRLADMIRWLVRSAEQVSAGAVTVRFACRGPQLKVAIEHEETLS